MMGGAYGGVYGGAPMMGGAYGGHPYGGQVGHPYLDEKVIATQQEDAANALKTQATVQGDMLEHQHTAQVKMLKAECDRNVLSAQQYQLQLDMHKQLADAYRTSMPGAGAPGGAPGGGKGGGAPPGGKGGKGKA